MTQQHARNVHLSRCSVLSGHFYESDIDIAIISPALYERIMGYIHDYQMELRENRKAVSYEELN